MSDVGDESERWDWQDPKESMEQRMTLSDAYFLKVCRIQFPDDSSESRDA